MEELKLDKDTGNTILIVGSSKSGKTTFLMRIYNKYFKNRHDMIKTLFATHTQLNIYRSDHELLMCEGFPKDAQEYISDQVFLNRNTSNCYQFLNVFDDILDVRHSKIINESILSLRNSNISSIICLQYTHLFSKAARSSVNNIIFFSFNTDESIEGVLNTFLKSSFRKIGIAKEDMINVYRDLTRDHNYLYFHPATGYLFSSKKGILITGHDGS
jgi:GTPase SAR1 family protein